MAVLDELPSTFTYAQARGAGMSRSALYRLRDQGVLIQVGHGLYRRSSDAAVDLDLVEIALRATRPTLCLTTALAQHGLTDEIPVAYDVAIPAGSGAPVVAAPVSWHRFAAETFDLGRETFAVDDSTSMGIYNAERCIVDAFRLRGHQPPEVGTEALRQWLRRGGRPAGLLELASNFTRVQRPIRETLEILL